jgi:hypothetical protein
MNLKLKNSEIVHYQAIKFPDGEHIGSQRNQPVIWGHWALCGAAGTRKLKEVESSVNCKSCLIIESKLRGKPNES